MYVTGEFILTFLVLLLLHSLPLFFIELAPQWLTGLESRSYEGARFRDLIVALTHTLSYLLLL